VPYEARLALFDYSFHLLSTRPKDRTCFDGEDFMGQATYRVADIQRQLDESAKAFNFPMLDNGSLYLADVRLHAYRDEKRWAIVIEQLGFNPQAGGHGGIVNCLYRYGNCLTRPPGLGDEDLLNITSDGKSGPTFADETGLLVRRELGSIRVRGIDFGVNLSPTMQQNAGVRLLDQNQIQGFELVRLLLPKYRDFLLANEDELRARVPADLEEILVLDEWQHPDLAQGQLPSGSPTFRMIIKVLVAGDPVFYQPGPKDSPNTHWKHWPNSGQLA